jgi:hypothetical protein
MRRRFQIIRIAFTVVAALLSTLPYSRNATAGGSGSDKSGSHEGAISYESLYYADRLGSEPRGDRLGPLGHDDALDARQAGQIISLKEALAVANPGKEKVIEVKLFRYLHRAVYRIKLRHVDGSIESVRVNALNGKLDGLFR